jgi:hypothetical protein
VQARDFSAFFLINHFPRRFSLDNFL